MGDVGENERIKVMGVILKVSLPLHPSIDVE